MCGGAARERLEDVALPFLAESGAVVADLEAPSTFGDLAAGLAITEAVKVPPTFAGTLVVRATVSNPTRARARTPLAAPSGSFSRLSSR